MRGGRETARNVVEIRLGLVSSCLFSLDFGYK